MFENGRGAGSGSAGPCLADLAPGSELLAALVAVPSAHRSRGERIDVIAGWERMIAYAQAQQLTEIAAFAREQPWDEPTAEAGSEEEVYEFAPDELAPALAVSPISAGTRLGLALDLADRLPATRDALAAGVLTLPKARLLVSATRALSDEAARMTEAEVLPQAGRLTWGQMKRAVDAAVLRVDPRSAEQRHQIEAAERRVVFTPETNGMAWLSLYTTADVALAGYTAADARARQVAADPGRDPADKRGLDALRADALAEMFAAALDEPALPRRHRLRPHILVTVPVGTVLGVDDEPGELAGYGPIPASLARRIAADGTWRRLLTDPASGALLDVGRTAYEPPAALADFVLVRDQTCRYFGCPRPAWQCDLDHTVPFPEGPTAEHNLGPDCRRHHRLKHSPPWRQEQPASGHFRWTTPTGRVFTVTARPLGPVAKVPQPQPPPPPDDQLPPF